MIKEEQITDSEEQIKLKQLSLIKAKMRTATIDSNEVLLDLSQRAKQSRTSSVVLVGIIIMAENITISKPREQDAEREALEVSQPQTTENAVENLSTDIELLPEAANVITNAVNNPNSNQVVADVARAAVENLSQNTEESSRNKVSDFLSSLREMINTRMQEFEQNNLHSSENTDRTPSLPTPQYSVVDAQSKYGVVNSYGIVRDSEGKHHAMLGMRDEDGKWAPEIVSEKTKPLSKEIIHNFSGKEL